MKNIVLLILFNCSQKEKKITKTENTEKFLIATAHQKYDINNKELQQSLEKAILEGYTVSYIKSYKAYTTSGKDKDFLYYAILMAEKKNYKRAYYDISRILALRVDDPPAGASVTLVSE